MNLARSPGACIFPDVVGNGQFVPHQPHWTPSLIPGTPPLLVLSHFSSCSSVASAGSSPAPPAGLQDPRAWPADPASTHSPSTSLGDFTQTHGRQCVCSPTTSTSTATPLPRLPTRTAECHREGCGCATVMSVSSRKPGFGCSRRPRWRLPSPKTQLPPFCTPQATLDACTQRITQPAERTPKVHGSPNASLLSPHSPASAPACIATLLQLGQPSQRPHLAKSVLCIAPDPWMWSEASHSTAPLKPCTPPSSLRVKAQVPSVA